MLKLPLELAVHPDWQVVLRNALKRRSQLEEEAKTEQLETGENIRPVLFIQAEKRHKTQETMTADKVKQVLIDDFKISANDIAICIGGVDEIGDRQMEDANFPRVIITVDKLREGWDCPFAYVMMTFRNTTSRVAVEQVVGRILRMPHVKRKKREALNRAYCYSCSTDFSEVVRNLKDGLVESGFERMATNDLIVMPDDGRAGDEDMFEHNQEMVISLPVVNYEIQMPSLADFSTTMQRSVELNPENGTLTLIGKPSPAFKKKIIKAIADAAGEDAGKVFELEVEQQLETWKTGRPASDFPSRKGEFFTVPQLMIRQGTFFAEFEQSALLDGEWTLSDDFDPVLNEEEFNTSPEEMKKFRFEMQSGNVQYSFYEHQEQQLMLHQREGGWDITTLTQWLDWNTDFHYADQTDKVAWIRRMLEELEGQREVNIEELAFRKFRLREAVRKKLQSGLAQVQQLSFADLLQNEEVFEVPGGAHCITFSEGHYGYNHAYAGRYQFKKHFFPQIGDLKAQGEEFDCACRIDQHPDVKWWVRNVEKQPGAFWLQTSRGRFYPDFVVKLKSGKIVVVEYKGQHLAENVSEIEKDDIGQLWERRSENQCGFSMVKNRDWEELDSTLSGE